MNAIVFPPAPAPLAAGFLAVVGLLLAGCARVYDVEVDAIHNPEIVGGHSYKIVSKEPGMEERDPHYGEAVKMVKNALSGRGMYEAPFPDDAEVVVEIDYGVGPRRMKIETEEFPAAIDPVSRLGIPPIGRTYPGRRYPGGGYPGMGYPPGTIQTPDGRIVQPITPTESITATPVTEKRLSIVAREAPSKDPAGEKRPRELWRVEVSVEDSQPDIGRVLPVMAGAAADYIGADTRTRQTVRVSEDAEAVVFVKGGG